MNRRELLAGLAGVAGGLILPASVAENAEAGRRWWALGALPVRNTIYLRDHRLVPIITVSSDKGSVQIDAMLLYSPHGRDAIKNEVLRHARWLRERGARDLVLHDERWYLKDV